MEGDHICPTTLLLAEEKNTTDMQEKSVGITDFSHTVQTEKRLKLFKIKTDRYIWNQGKLREQTNTKWKPNNS